MPERFPFAGFWDIIKGGVKNIRLIGSAQRSKPVETKAMFLRSLLVCGFKSSFEIKPLEMFEGDGEDEHEFLEKTEYTDHDWGSRGKHERSDDFYRYNALFEGFAAMVRGEKENPYTPDYELELYRTLLKCRHL